MIEAIGGYFELELPAPSDFLHPEAMRYQSARAAFLALLRSVKPRRVWMPHYICDSMLAPIHAASIELCYYALDEELFVLQNIDLQAQDVFLYVNYFGVCDRQVDRVLERLNPMQVIIDCSQAFYAKPKKCLATIYSPRKFFGLPDGGLLVTDHIVPVPREKDQSSEKRIEHLIKRIGNEPEAGYAAFQQAEASLSDMEPRTMSTTSCRMLGAVRFEAARIVRNQNFEYLRKHLDNSNCLSFQSEVDGPLCYPYWPKYPVKKEHFIRQRIFIATYWQDVLKRVAINSLEEKLVNQCLPMPCDQRYSFAHMNKIIGMI